MTQLVASSLHAICTTFFVELDQDQDQDVQREVDRLHRRIKGRQLESMYTKNPTSNGGRKRARTDKDKDNHTGEVEMTAHSSERMVMR